MIVLLETPFHCVMKVQIEVSEALFVMCLARSSVSTDTPIGSQLAEHYMY